MVFFSLNKRPKLFHIFFSAFSLSKKWYHLFQEFEIFRYVHFDFLALTPYERSRSFWECTLFEDWDQWARPDSDDVPLNGKGEVLGSEKKLIALHFGAGKTTSMLTNATTRWKKQLEDIIVRGLVRINISLGGFSHNQSWSFIRYLTHWKSNDVSYKYHPWYQNGNEPPTNQRNERADFRRPEMMTFHRQFMNLWGESCLIFTCSGLGFFER